MDEKEKLSSENMKDVSGGEKGDNGGISIEIGPNGPITPISPYPKVKPGTYKEIVCPKCKATQLDFISQPGEPLRFRCRICRTEFGIQDMEE